MHGETDQAARSGREAFISDLVNIGIERAEEPSERPTSSKRIGYHLRWIVINLILIAAGAYAASHYLKLRALGPEPEAGQSVGSDKNGIPSRTGSERHTVADQRHAAGARSIASH